MTVSKLFIILLVLATPLRVSANTWAYLVGDGSTIKHIAINPHNPAIIYAVADNRDYVDRDRDNYLFKSDDYGLNWTHIAERTKEELITSITIDPQNTKTVYMTTESIDYNGYYIYKSNNDGNSWDKQDFDHRIVSLIVNPYDNTLLYVLAVGIFYKSYDAGKTWEEISWVADPDPGPDPVPIPATSVTMTIDPHNPDIIYVQSVEIPVITPTGDGFFKSIDQGLTWVRKADSFSYSGGSKKVALVIDPHNPNVLYSSDPSLKTINKSIDAGETWQEVNSDSIELGIEAMVIDPFNPETIYIGTQSGLYRTTNSGGKWTLLSHLVDGKELTIKSLTIDPQNPETIYVGTFGKGIYIVTTDNHCIANYNLSTHTVKIPCLGVDSAPPYYEVELKGNGSDGTYKAIRVESR